nr:hypothetical protein [Tenacibaculum ovolyticum]
MESILYLVSLFASDSFDISLKKFSKPPGVIVFIVIPTIVSVFTKRCGIPLSNLIKSPCLALIFLLPK